MEIKLMEKEITPTLTRFIKGAQVTSGPKRSQSQPREMMVITTASHINRLNIQIPSVSIRRALEAIADESLDSKQH